VSRWSSLLLKQCSRCRPQWELLSHPEPVKTVSDPDGAVSKPLFIIPRGAPPSVTFIYRSPPQSRVSAEAHEAGRFALSRVFPGIVTQAADGFSGDVKGDVLFATHPCLSDAALRAALEKKNKLVLLCRDEPAGMVGTYHTMTEEAAFLAGALAGSLSRSARIGWLRPLCGHSGHGYDLQAFAQGAAAARPAVRVHTAAADGRAVFQRLAERGVDIVYLPCEDTGIRPALKSFPGVYAHLCALSGNGAVAETLAAAAWHWDAFYVKFIRGIVDGGSPAAGLHVRMGLDSGVLGLHLTAGAMGAGRCLAVFRHALVSGVLSAVDENAPMEVYEV
jgi:basic membrane lipoprotein Med (substrate-binding protein (PBP1-ABC) superfamily)